MFVFIPVLCFFIIWRTLRDKIPLPWRWSFLGAALICGALVVVSVESLSWAHLLTFPAVLAFWITTLSVSLFCYIRFPNKNAPSSPHREKLKKIDVFLCCLILCLLLVLAIVAFVAPPNNWDSMTYHMSRVTHWIQNKTLAYYPTHINRQLYISPWTEYAVFHLQILSGTDRWANMVQWFSLLGCAIGVSLMTQLIGGCRRRQILSALIAVTLPMAQLQSTSTQTDLTVAFWLVSLAAFLLLCWDNQKLAPTLAAGVSFGLTVLTKASAYLYGGTLLLIWIVFRWKKSAAWKKTGLILALMVGVNAGYFIRNISLYQTILPDTGLHATNETFSPPAIVSNIIKNLALHMSPPNEKIASAINKGLTALHTKIGLDINDKRTTWGGDGFSIPTFFRHEDHQGNFAHFYLYTFCLILLLLNAPKRRHPPVLFLLLAVIGSFLLFCIVMKWQPWHSRMHLPFFVLAAPLAAIALPQKKNAFISLMVAVFLVGTSAPFLLYNRSRPLLGPGNIFKNKRIDQYFMNQYYIGPSYKAAADYLKSKNINQIGLVISADSWEYPFWALLAPGRSPDVRIEHVDVTDLSGKKTTYPRGPFVPDVILYSSSQPVWQKKRGQDLYVKTRVFPAPLEIFERDTTGRLVKTNLLDHLNRLQTISRQITSNQPLLAKNLVALFQIRQQEYVEATLIDCNELEKLHNDFGRMFREVYLKGLELRLVALQRGDSSLYQQAANLLLKWDNWFNANKKSIQQKFLSF